MGEQSFYTVFILILEVFSKFYFGSCVLQIDSIGNVLAVILLITKFSSCTTFFTFKSTHLKKFTFIKYS